MGKVYGAAALGCVTALGVVALVAWWQLPAIRARALEGAAADVKRIFPILGGFPR